MGASVQPVQATPGDRISRNVAAMQAQGASDHDIETYLTQVEGIKPENDTSLSMRNVGRAAMQGATFGFGDEIGLTDRTKENAFKNANPWTDLLAKLVGGAAAPVAAVMAAPVLGSTLGGAAALGAGMGLLTGAGEADGSMADRAKGAIQGGLLGAGGGAAGYGTGKLLGGLASKVLDRANPDRVVARSASDLVNDPSVASNMAATNALAPGGTSLATGAVPPVGQKTSRLLPMLKLLADNPKASASAEASMVGQKAALKSGADAIGAKMDALSGDIPVTGKLRSAMDKVRDVLGGKTPEIPVNDEFQVAPPTPPQTITTAQSPAPTTRDAIDAFWARQGVAAKRTEGTVAQQMARQSLERHGAEDAVSPGLRGSPTVIPGNAAVMAPETVDLQTLRDALSRLRFMARQAEKRGIDANGVTIRDLAEARDALQSVLYQSHPEFAGLDKQYATVMSTARQADKALNAIQVARSTGATQSASIGPLGIPRGSHSALVEIANKVLTDKAGTADAVARLIVKPGGPEMIQNLLKKVPSKSTSRVGAPIGGLLSSQLRGLLSPASP